MDGFPSFFKKTGEDWEKLEIEPSKLKNTASKLLTQLNLELKDIQSTKNPGDYIAASVNPIGTETRSLIRVRDYSVGVTEEDVEDLYEDMLNANAKSAIFITTSHFTKEAKKFAKNLPIQLVDGVTLGDLMKEHYVPKAEIAFISAFEDDSVVRYFKKQRKRKIAGILGTEEKIEEIDRRYIPLGHFIIKKVSKDTETTKNVYVDLSDGNILYMDEDKIEENGFFKRVLDLPQESQTHLLDLIKYGELKHKHLDGKSLNILEKENLVKVEEKSTGGGILDIVLDELSSTISVATSEVTTLTHPEPKEKAIEIETKKYVKEIMNKPVIDSSYNLGQFIESGPPDPSFDPDPIHYDPKKVEEVLDTIYTEEDVSFVELAYLPYYRCKYVSHYGSVRFKKLFAPKFKGFVPKGGAFIGLCRIIDTVPAIPYLIIAAAFVLLNAHRLNYVAHVLAIGFIFVTVSVLVAIILKLIFKTERRMPRYSNTVIRYGFPSIHALTSAGAVAFVYFVDPMMVLLFAPLSVLYIYSRLKLRVHNEVDVIGGLIVGLILGLIFGAYVLPTLYLGEIIEGALAALFFIVPLIVTVAEQQFR